MLWQDYAKRRMGKGIRWPKRIQDQRWLQPSTPCISHRRWWLQTFTLGIFQKENSQSLDLLAFGRIWRLSDALRCRVSSFSEQTIAHLKMAPFLCKDEMWSFAISTVFCVFLDIQLHNVWPFRKFLWGFTNGWLSQNSCQLSVQMTTAAILNRISSSLVYSPRHACAEVMCCVSRSLRRRKMLTIGPISSKFEVHFKMELKLCLGCHNVFWSLGPSQERPGKNSALHKAVENFSLFSASHCVHSTACPLILVCQSNKRSTFCCCRAFWQTNFVSEKCSQISF